MGRTRQINIEVSEEQGRSVLVVGERKRQGVQFQQGEGENIADKKEKKNIADVLMDTERDYEGREEKTGCEVVLYGLREKSSFLCK
jgi:hypothetical protein